MVVLDEADKLLSDDFVESVNKLLPYTPGTRQLLLFSATFPKSVITFKDQWLKNPFEVNLMEELTLKVFFFFFLIPLFRNTNTGCHSILCFRGRTPKSCLSCNTFQKGSHVNKCENLFLFTAQHQPSDHFLQLSYSS